MSLPCVCHQSGRGASTSNTASRLHPFYGWKKPSAPLRGRFNSKSSCYKRATVEKAVLYELVGFMPTTFVLHTERLVYRRILHQAKEPKDMPMPDESQPLLLPPAYRSCRRCASELAHHRPISFLAVAPVSAMTSSISATSSSPETCGAAGSPESQPARSGCRCAPGCCRP